MKIIQIYKINKKIKTPCRSFSVTRVLVLLAIFPHLLIYIYYIFFFIFTEKPTNMFIENTTSDGVLVVIEGNEAIIACFVESGQPKEEIILYQNRKKLISGGPGFIKYTFTPSRYDHLNNFTCTANNNNSSEIETTIKLFVHGKMIMNILYSPIRIKAILV